MGVARFHAMGNIVIHWFRRDLRLQDNSALYHALSENKQVLPIFIFDEHILSQLPKDDARVTFIYQQLEKIQVELNKIGKSLAVFHGKPIEIFTYYEKKEYFSKHLYVIRLY